MKRNLLIIFLSSFILLIFSCSKNSAEKNSSAPAEDIYTEGKKIIAEGKDIISQEKKIIAEEKNIIAEEKDNNASEANIAAPDADSFAKNTGITTPVKIDIDLTKASKTIIYATVFNMVVEPDDFIGKTVRVSGNFRVFEDDYSDDRYYAIIIPDATACCETGIEFIWEGEHNYPEDYPAVEQKITITGKYNVMEFEDGVSYFYLDVSDIEF